MKDKSFVDVLPQRLIRKKYWEWISTHKFILSPHGNGLDCHRTYESLLLGVIPIVRKSSLSDCELYDGLPILVVDNWADINEQMLNEFYE